MSNKAGTWEYKFEASKEIPVLRFPVPDFVYNDPNTPFKLEAGLKIGAYFNAALKVTSDPNELLPTAGGSLGFYGRLSVMCVSLSAATVYAIGQVNLDIAADTKLGPALRMKFGFGAQIVVGLPVVGNVSVLFIVGVEIFAPAGSSKCRRACSSRGTPNCWPALVASRSRSRRRAPSRRRRSAYAHRPRLPSHLRPRYQHLPGHQHQLQTSWEEQRQIA